MTTPHTPPAAPDLAAIEARAAAATRGPWHADHEFGYVDAPVLMRGAIVCSLDSDLCDDTDGADAEFIAHAREDIPALLAHITALRAQHAADVAAAVAGERERAASAAESHAIDCDLDAEDERTNGTLGGCTVAQDRAKLARMIRDGIRKPACTICEEPATCFGSSEGDPPSYHCDDCCGHGGEDGHCEPVGADAIAATPATGGA